MAIQADDFATSGEINPGANASAITPADTPLAQRTRAVYVGGAGDLAVRMAGNDQVVTFKSVAAGSLLPIRVTEIRLATTATDVLAVW